MYVSVSHPPRWVSKRVSLGAVLAGRGSGRSWCSPQPGEHSAFLLACPVLWAGGQQAGTGTRVLAGSKCDNDTRPRRIKDGGGQSSVGTRTPATDLEQIERGRSRKKGERE